MKRTITVVCCAVSVFFSNGYAEIYLWPLHGERLLSSSFGEYRVGHYHAGIDLRTSGQTGLPCLAVGDGAVIRLKISPVGYGKALYLRLDDGLVAVYAHLDGFDYRLDSLTYYQRLARGTSWCDIQLPAEVYRCRTGDTVCFSGATAAAAPHLHFEIRDEGGRPINPLEKLYAVPDERPPVLSGLEIVPLAAGSIVNGSPLPVTVLLRASGSSGYVFPDTLQLEGRFGFAVSVWDEQGFGEYALAPLSVELFVDDVPLFGVRNSVFSFEQAGEIAVGYDLLGEGPAGRYLLLYRKPGSTRTDCGGPGVVHADELSSDGLMTGRGLHAGRIVARDAAGNAAEARFTFAMNRRPVIDTARRLRAGTEVIVRAHDPDGGTLFGRLSESLDGGEHWTPVPLEPRGSFLAAAVSSAADALYRYVVRDGEGGRSERYFAAPTPVDREGMVFAECSTAVVQGGLVLRIRTDQPLAADPLITVDGTASLDSCRIYRSGLRCFTVLCAADLFADGTNVVTISGVDYRGFPLRARTAVRLCRLRTGSRVPFTLSDTIRVVLESPAVRGEALCMVGESPAPGREPRGLRPVSPPFSVEFSPELMIRSLRIACETAGDVGLFRWEKDASWGCVGVPAREGGAVGIPGPGLYAFFGDGLPPEMQFVASEPVARGSGFYGSIRYYVPVREDGSGIDPYSAAATMNGEPLVCEWDGIGNRLVLPIPAALPRGAARLHVELSDRTGNRSAGDFSFMLE